MAASLRLLQLADSAFPAGSFAHSAGLEAALQLAPRPDDVERLIVGALWQAATASLPYVHAAHGGLDELAALDRHCEASTLNHVASRASRAQGRALLATFRRVFPEARELIVAAGRSPHRHLAPLYGALHGAVGLALDEVLRLFLFASLRSALSAAVRLGALGPLRAQAILAERAAVFEEALAFGASLSVEQSAQSAPMLDFWQAHHDRLPSRLFQS